MLTSSNPTETASSIFYFSEGEWQTVRNKEQKSQRKEKKRHDEITVISSTAVPVKPVATTSYTPAYTSIPSTAKGKYASSYQCLQLFAYVYNINQK